MAKDGKITLSALLRAGSCAMSYTNHPRRPRRYYIDGRMVARGFYETVEAAARRRDCFYTRYRRDQIGVLYAVHASFAYFRS